MNQPVPVMNQLVQNGIWILPCLALFYVAWRRFSQPPTNRFATTFHLFHTGVIIYYAFLIAIWLAVIGSIRSGGTKIVDGLGVPPEMVGLTAPLVAMIVITVGSLNATITKIDDQVRSLCLGLAAIPKEADQLALELAQKVKFQIKDKNLEQQISEFIIDNIGPDAVDFENSDSMAYRFTRAVSLYHIFIAPESTNSPPAFPINPSTYAKVMKANEDTVAATHDQYDDVMELALKYFTTSKKQEYRKRVSKTKY